MSAALVIALKDLRRRLRDRSALVLTFVAPLGVAALMSFAFSSAESFHADIALVDQDRGVLALALHGVLTSPELTDVVTVHVVASEADARARVDDDAVGTALLIPPGFSAGATGDRPLSLRVLVNPDNPLQAQVAAAIASAFTAQINADRLSVHTALAAGVAPARLPELAAKAAELRLPEQAVERPTGFRQLSAASYFAPAMGMFFLFFIIGFTARDYFAEQRDGTLERIGAAPIGRNAVLLGKSLATFVYGVTSLGLLAVLTTLAFGASWGPPFAAAALIGALGVMLVALTAFVIAVTNSETQAEGFASILTFALVLLGGNFVLIGQAPEVLRDLALFTPNGWALRGITDLATGAERAAVVRPTLAILAMAAGVGAVAALVNHWRRAR